MQHQSDFVMRTHRASSSGSSSRPLNRFGFSRFVGATLILTFVIAAAAAWLGFAPRLPVDASAAQLPPQTGLAPGGKPPRAATPVAATAASAPVAPKADSGSTRAAGPAWWATLQADKAKAREAESNHQTNTARLDGPIPGPLSDDPLSVSEGSASAPAASDVDLAVPPKPRKKVQSGPEIRRVQPGGAQVDRGKAKIEDDWRKRILQW
jgi:hypothetical protein